MKRKPERTSESYVISVSFDTGCYRHIRISASSTLQKLSTAILKAFDFDNDHMHAFFMNNRLWNQENAYFSHTEEKGERSTAHVRLSYLNPEIGLKFKYLFDFGDEWVFQCRILKRIEEVTKTPLVVRSIGEAPSQYGEDVWDEALDDDEEWDEYEDWDDEDEDDEAIALPIISYSDELYEKAFLFKQTKLWKKLFDSQLFAIRHSDGTIGYCCVMGMMGEHTALAVYPGDEGLAAYRMMYDGASPKNEQEAQESMLSQNCVMLSFENKPELFPKEEEAAKSYAAPRQIVFKGRHSYPHFQRFRPQFFPWSITSEADKQYLAEALDAAVAVSEALTMILPERIGFSEGDPYDRKIPLLTRSGEGFQWSDIQLPKPKPIQYPSAQADDEIAVRKLLKSKGNGIWACDIRLHNQPFASQKDAPNEDAPCFPYFFIIVNNLTGMVLCANMSSPDSYAEAFGKVVIDSAIKFGKPKRILASNDRTYALLADLAKQIGTQLSKEKELPLLEEAMNAIYRDVFTAERNPQAEREQIIEMLSDPKVMSELPSELLTQLLLMRDKNMLPDDIIANLEAEKEKRGL